jgi:hypothetical protein
MNTAAAATLRAATIYETFEPTWPGQAPQWVCVVRAGTEGRGPVVHTAEASADALGQRRARKAARVWCKTHGYGDAVPVLDGPQATRTYTRADVRAARAWGQQARAALARMGVR